MTALTPKMSLPYPTGTDRPCDGGQQIIALRDEIYKYLDQFTDTKARQEDPPMASVAYIGAGQIVPGGQAVAYNVIEQDDLRAADLIATSTVLTVGKPGFEGVYITGFLVETTTTVDGWYQNLSGSYLDSDRAFDQDPGSWWHRGGSAPYPTMCGSTLLLAQGPVTINLSHTQSDRIVISARLWAVRIGRI